MPPKRKSNESVIVGDKPKRGRKKAEAHAEEAIEAIPEEPPVDLSIYADFKLELPSTSGELLFCGGSNWDLIGRKSVPAGTTSRGGRSVFEPRRVESVKGKRFVKIISHCTASHSVAIDSEGKAYTWGRNEKSQLGHGDSDRRDDPTFVDSLDGLTIVDAACGRSHTVFLTDTGVVYACGDNKNGQLGLGMQSNSVPKPTKMAYAGPPIKRLACGADFTMIVNILGQIYSMGCPEYGQLGHNTDGKYFVSANKLDFNCETKPRRIPLFVSKNRDQIEPITDVIVVEIACGTNHTVALDKNKRVFTWGFGGYGRLGHAEQKDEMIPRLVGVFPGDNRGATMIGAGGAFSMAVHTLGSLFLWGQNKPTGEATMYPKQVQDLNGWLIRSIGCSNRSIIVAADDSLVSWGPSPTYGELGYGPNTKSSTKPLEVKPVKNCYILQVACGMGHTLLLARNDNEADQTELNQLQEFSPDKFNN